MSRIPRCLVLVLAALPAAPAPVMAQARLTGADVQGVVRDESKAVLPGAVVTAVNKDTNVARTATSDAQGRFVLAALPPGTYKIAAALQGFATHTRDGVGLQLGQSVDLEFTLKIAGGKEELTVVTEAPVIDPSDTSVSSVVGRQQIENLPINGRNFISFSIITPGVTTDRTPQQGASATSGLSFTGQRASSNNIMVDGLDNNDAVVGSVRATFTQEAIREFQVITNSYSAEFGKASGGVVNIVTKSGTNEFRGNAFWYFRDKSLNAKDHFEKFDVFGNPIDRDKAPFQSNQFGATLGAPIRKDRSLSLSQTNVLSGRWVNEARVQVAREDQKINSLDPRCGGDCLTNDQGGPTLEITGFATVGRQRFTPQPRKNTRLQMSETVSFFAGKHSAKAGVDFNTVNSPDDGNSLPLHFGGRYIFASLPAIPGLIPAPINALQAFALGLPAAYVQGYGNSFAGYGYKDVSLFVQDEWRASRPLTIKPRPRYQKHY